VTLFLGFVPALFLFIICTLGGTGNRHLAVRSSVTAKRPLPSPSSLRQLDSSALASRLTADWRGYGKPHVYETNGWGKIRIGFVLGLFFDKSHVFNWLKQFGAISFLCFCTGFFQLSLRFSPVHRASWLSCSNPARPRAGSPRNSKFEKVRVFRGPANSL
jgi:hypothetical protein